MTKRSLLGFGIVMALGLSACNFFVAPEPPPAPEHVDAPPEGVEETASGISHELIQAGTGTRHPSATDTVTVHYSGWTRDGELFDSSLSGGPAEFPLNNVIAGWTEGVQLMVEGEKRRFWIPPSLAYGSYPGRGRPAGMLVFEIELISIR